MINDVNSSIEQVRVLKNAILLVNKSLGEKAKVYVKNKAIPLKNRLEVFFALPTEIKKYVDRNYYPNNEKLSELISLLSEDVYAGEKAILDYKFFESVFNKKEKYKLRGDIYNFSEDSLNDAFEALLEDFVGSYLCQFD